MKCVTSSVGCWLNLKDAQMVLFMNLNPLKIALLLWKTYGKPFKAGAWISNGVAQRPFAPWLEADIRVLLLFRLRSRTLLLSWSTRIFASNQYAFWDMRKWSIVSFLNGLEVLPCSIKNDDDEWWILGRRVQNIISTPTFVTFTTH